MRTLIAVPCMDMVATGFCQSLAMLKKVGDCYVTHVAGSLIYDSRNKIAAKAIQLECDYVMWFDSDMIFEPNTLERLMADIKDKDFVSGVYYRRSGNYSPVLYKDLIRHEDGTVEAIAFDSIPDEMFTAAGVGFGCVLTSTAMLLDMAAKYKDWFTPNGKLGEDLSFCERARNMGYEIWVDPKIKCGHVGHIIVNEGFFEAYKQAEELKK